MDEVEPVKTRLQRATGLRPFEGTYLLYVDVQRNAVRNTLDCLNVVAPRLEALATSLHNEHHITRHDTNGNASRNTTRHVYHDKLTIHLNQLLQPQGGLPPFTRPTDVTPLGRVTRQGRFSVKCLTPHSWEEEENGFNCCG